MAISKIFIANTDTSSGSDNDDNDNNEEQLLDEDLEKKLQQKNNKSAGLNQICAEIYKYSFENTSVFMLKLFNRLLLKGEYPDVLEKELSVHLSKAAI